jgi:hypothetical protein
MSFGRDDASADIRSAIQSAQRKNIILLAAASNFGNMQKMSYPAREHSVFPIFAADAYGLAVKFSPPPRPHESNFSILGLAVESTWPSSKRKQDVTTKKDGTKWKCLSGTSVATPIAAALVALIFQYHDIHRGEIEIPKGSQGLKTYSAVRSVLHGMCTADARHSYDNLVPWRAFESYIKKDRVASRLEDLINEAE